MGWRGGKGEGKGRGRRGKVEEGRKKGGWVEEGRVEKGGGEGRAHGRAQVPAGLRPRPGGGGSSGPSGHLMARYGLLTCAWEGSVAAWSSVTSVCLCVPRGGLGLGGGRGPPVRRPPSCARPRPSSAPPPLLSRRRGTGPPAVAWPGEPGRRTHRACPRRTCPLGHRGDVPTAGVPAPQARGHPGRASLTLRGEISFRAWGAPGCCAGDSSGLSSPRGAQLEQLFWRSFHESVAEVLEPAAASSRAPAEGRQDV